MRNLKKVLALVIAVAMFASFGFVASAAYTDVAPNANYADAVNLLSNLGILKGYEDGSFRPDNTVTRAEAATMIVRMLALDDGVAQGATDFTDVSADHWASGYINVATAYNIVAGMGDGTFDPEAEVTYGQVVKMIVCALGYEPVAMGNGGWNGGGYIFAGSKAGFTKGVSGTASEAASRATIARLIYNALEIELMDQTTYSDGINGGEWKVLANKTILTEYLELEKVDGVIVETYLSNTNYEEGDNTVDVVITKNYANEDEINVDYEVGDVVSAIADGTDAATLLGYSVVAYIGENEDGDDEIFAVAEKAGKNELVVLDTELITSILPVADEDDEPTGEYEIVYHKSESTRTATTAMIENYVSIGKNDAEYTDFVVVNGFNNAGYTLANVEDENSEYALFDGEAYKDLDEISLLDNDNDGEFEFVFATMPNTDTAVDFVVEETDAEDYTITAKGDGEGLSLDYDDDDMLITIIKDGQIVDFSAIAEGDVVTVLDTSVNVLTVYVSTTVVEGSVDEIDGDVHTIAGNEYKLSPISEDVDPADGLELGEEGLFYVNASGKITYVDTVQTIAGADYVYVIALDKSVGDFGATEYLVKVVTASGAIEVLTLRNKKIDMVGADITEEAGKDLEDEEAYANLVAEFGTGENFVAGIARIDTTAAGEISAIYLPGAEDFDVDESYKEEDEDTEFNAKRSTYGHVDIDSNTIVFNYTAEDVEEILDENDEVIGLDYEDAVTVTTALNLFEDGSSYKFTAYGSDDDAADVLVTLDAETDLDAGAPVMVVTKVTDYSLGDDDTVKITGIAGGETVSVIVDPEDTGVAADVAKGNVILYAQSGDYVTDVEILLASPDEAETFGDLGELTNNGAESDIVIDGSFSDDAVTTHKGLVVDAESKWFMVGNDFPAEDEDPEGDKYYFADEVNYVTVDYAYASVSIKAGKKADIKASEKNPVYVFVKTAAEAEDEVTDVVIFKGLN